MQFCSCKRLLHTVLRSSTCCARLRNQNRKLGTFVARPRGSRALLLGVNYCAPQSPLTRSISSKGKTGVMFIEAVDPASGERTWKVVDEDYDLAQEIARSAFADMLHDQHRNDAYEAAIRTVVEQLHSSGKEVRVTDIGTGTGLLALMAARAGAERISAIEVFRPMAECAKKIFEASEFADKIRLITSRSTDLSHGDVEERANLIVAEVFDTELIGEGALRTFKEAQQTIAEKHSRVVPSSGRVWITAVESEFLMRFHRAPCSSLRTPFAHCPGAAAVFDLQLSQVSPEKIRLISEPFVAFRFNFEDGDSIEYNESFVHKFDVVCEKEAVFEAILMWWDLDMDGSGNYALSMAPKWWDSGSAWRDHWMQAIYFLPKAAHVRKGDTVSLRCSHDEFSFWFDIPQTGVKMPEALPERPACVCRLHSVCSRNAVYRLNALDSDVPFDEMLQKECRGKKVICANDGSLSGLLCAKYATEVVVLESNPNFRSVLQAYCELNQLHNVSVVAREEHISLQADTFLSEPFFVSSMLPWHNLRCWLIADRLKSRFGPNLKILPGVGTLWALGVQFEDLWKIAAPVGTVNGFDLSLFDEVCLKARTATDAIVEPQPLWEYPSVCTSYPTAIASFDMTIDVPLSEISFSKNIQFERNGTNALVFWMDWQLGDYRMKTGLMDDGCGVGKKPEWAVSHRQGVFFFPEGKRLDPNCRSVDVKAIFVPQKADISFSFSF